jgi:DNA-binding transcriptional ArsR family regulator
LGRNPGDLVALVAQICPTGTLETKQPFSIVVRERFVNWSNEMALLKAISHPCIPVRRLLELAETWPGSLPNKAPASIRCRTAKQLRSDELDKLAEGYQSGATVYQLAKRFGIHRATVGSHLRARGIDTTPSGLRPEDVPAAAELYRDGWSLQRIGEKFGTSDSTVRARLLDVGVRMREAHERMG